MSDVDWAEGRTITTAELPAAITAYLLAHRDHDVPTAVGTFTPDAVVTDDGHTYHGLAEIAGWVASTASEYTFTTTLVGASAVDAARYEVRQHLEGDFPGGVVDLRYRFTMHGASIAALEIAA
ncbi:hypothetical protein Cme02nite_34300 [Catellatospora methionotrophica]|uniref:SnoaL-like domain-containing protein n=1 Tax=Catellatospora methionotrophica TaxID=121620 RepID=A0A8J3L603_9ACTN|nr:nuclear transport factor 2 family protein [Catellatospora methionotrophica]GIG15098.1 hypothetical protein Cme02nite_34300 [Catellatospora methionotrophica]